MIDFWVALFATGSALVGGTCFGLAIVWHKYRQEKAERKRAEKLCEELWLEVAAASPHSHDPSLGDQPTGDTATILTFPHRPTLADLGQDSPEPARSRHRRRRIGSTLSPRLLMARRIRSEHRNTATAGTRGSRRKGGDG